MTSEIVWRVLAFGALPAWLLAGAADWLCHRRTEIERTSGATESVWHMVLHAEIAVPLLLGLWLEINAGLLLFMAACVLAHMLTSLSDSRYAQPLRYISPIEQMVHSWLEMLPLFALVLITLLHADAFTDPHWLPAWRAEPLPKAWRIAVPVGLGCGFAMIFEEYLRGLWHLRARRALSAEPHL
ncbi:MAG TPA: hypothetical protein VM146_20100 [Steroidobacteraceae bacterium]|nr:hypothetical protein [Steroidobacteraceae bacterium]